MASEPPAYPSLSSPKVPTPALEAATARTARKVGQFYLPQLDGLRFVAYLLIFMNHSRWVPPSVAKWPVVGDTLLMLHRYGGISVDLFLVLSSFLITSLLLMERDARGEVSLGFFYMRRGLRVWPLYYVYVALAFVGVPMLLGSFWTPELQASVKAHGMPYLLFYGNFSPTWADHTPPAFTRHLWTISLEEQFYLLWPMTFAFLGVRPKHLYQVLVGAIVVGLVSRFVVAWYQIPNAAWRVLFTRLDPFAMGALLALYRHKVPAPKGRAWPKLGLGLALMVAVAMGPMIKAQTFHIVWQYGALAVGCTLIVDAVLDRDSKSAFPFLYHPVFVKMGKLTLGLYILHMWCVHGGEWIATRLGFDWKNSGTGWLFMMVVSFLISLVAALVSYRLIEAPFLRLKDRFTVVTSRTV